MYRLLDIKMIILLIVMLIASPVVWGKNTYTVCLVYSHYLTVYMNNVFLLTIYKYTSKINTLLPYFITRLKQDLFYKYTYFSTLSIGIIYTLIIYVSYYFFFGAIESEMLFMTILFMITNMIVMCVECSFIYMQIGQKKNFLYLVTPIVINFLFHICFTKLF